MPDGRSLPGRSTRRAGRSQTARVLAVLRQRGPYGTDQTEWLSPHVVDDGWPITRLAARINDLRQQGHTILVNGTRHGCAIYLIAEGAAPASAQPAEPRLFDPPAGPPRSPYDTDLDTAA